MRSVTADMPRNLSADRPIPDAHRWDAAIIAENAECAGVEQKVLAAAGRQPNPPRDQDAQHMAVREQRYVAVRGVGPCDHAIDAGVDLFRRFAARTPVAEDQ